MKIKNFKFTWKKEKEKICNIDGKEIMNLKTLKKFGITPTCFLNQLAKTKTHFNDKHEITHLVNEISSKMENLILNQEKKKFHERWKSMTFEENWNLNQIF